MKIESLLQRIPVMPSTRKGNVRPLISSFRVPVQEGMGIGAGRNISSSDKTSFGAKAMSAVMVERTKAATADRASSSAVISNQAKPYLSPDEVSFFEKIMSKSSGYNNGGAYAQGAVETGSYLHLKA